MEEKEKNNVPEVTDEVVDAEVTEENNKEENTEIVEVNNEGEEVEQEVIDSVPEEPKKKKEKKEKNVSSPTDEGFVSSSSDHSPNDSLWTPDRISNVIRGSIIMVIGLLLALSILFESPEAMNAISYIFGGVLILTGVVMLIISLLGRKSLYTSESILGGAVIALGILVMMQKMFNIVMVFIPLLVCVEGGVLLLAPLVRFFIKKDKAVFPFVMLLILGGVVLATGICLLTIDDFKRISAVVFGICIALYGLLVLMFALLNKQLSFKKKNK